ncbi:hypothetical protein PMAYCL1PPCAC_27138, partial [Pristionchus mayeri]
FDHMHRLILLCFSVLAPITAFWYLPACQPAYYECRCQRYNSCCSSTPLEIGYAMPRGVPGGWESAERFSPHTPSAKSHKFAFFWSDEEDGAEDDRTRIEPDDMTKTITPEPNIEMIVPPPIKRPKTKKGEESPDALLELSSAEIEQGRIKSSKSSKDDDLRTDSETPSTGSLLTSKGAGGEAKSTDWIKSAPVSTTPEAIAPAGMGGVSSGFGGGGMGFGGGSGFGSGFGGGGGGRSLFGMSSGTGVTAPFIGPIGGGWGFGVGK